MLVGLVGAIVKHVSRAHRGMERRNIITSTFDYTCLHSLHRVMFALEKSACLAGSLDINHAPLLPKPSVIILPAPVMHKIIHADHELNASATTVLQTGSSLVDPYSAIA